MKLRIDWLVVAALANVVVALVVALATPLAVSRASWSASLPLVGWLATAVIVYLVVLRERGLS